MGQVTIELTLEQLIEAVKKLTLEDQLRLVQSLVQEGPEEKSPDCNKRLSKAQVESEIDRLVQYLGGSRRLAGTGVERWVLDGDDDSELTVFTDLKSDEFQA